MKLSILSGGRSSTAPSRTTPPSSASAFERELAKANLRDLTEPIKERIDTLQRVVARDGKNTEQAVYVDLSNLQSELDNIRAMYRDLV